jgi:hypothetical protein
VSPPKTPSPYPSPNPLLPKSRPPAPTPAGRQSALAQFRAWRQWNRPLSTTINQDHEDAGLMILPTAQNPYAGIYVKHLVYSSAEIKLRIPPDATAEQILYAATSRPPNGSCLEVGTAYITEPNATLTNAVMYVYNFCTPNGGDFVIPPTVADGKVIDSQFLSTYAKTTAMGPPAYELEIFTKDSPPTSSSTWSAQIYNQVTSKWDNLYTAQGVADDNRGWSIFETYYQAGMCSESLPILGADQISLLNAVTGNWELVSTSMPLLQTSTDNGGVHNNNCFVDDRTGPASYVLLPNPPIYYSWSVMSRQQ